VPIAPLCFWSCYIGGGRLGGLVPRWMAVFAMPFVLASTLEDMPSSY
jgi:hypothetical protein